MKKKYKIALSYAHKDKDIADIVKKELENIFSGGFFMDELRPEELANADPFREKLENIFHRSEYAVILYSENYRKGQFTSTEMKKILKMAEERDDVRFFIINIDDCRGIDKDMSGCTYIVLNTNSSAADEVHPKPDVQEQLHDIVHNKIKKHIIMKTVEEKKREEEYSVRIQTLSANGNSFLWKMEYDWNLLGKAFIDEENGRKVKKETSWADLWKYVKTDFLMIKDELSKEPDVKRRIYLNCHLSIAYKLGQIYGDLRRASGNRNLFLESSNRDSDTVFELSREMHDTPVEDFCQNYEGNCCESADNVCIVSIKPKIQGNILETVKYFLEIQGKKYHKIYLFQKEMLIGDADSLENMAEYLRSKMAGYQNKSNCRIHLFPDTMAPLMFALGARTIFPGVVQLYEYYPGENTYTESLTNEN